MALDASLFTLHFVRRRTEPWIVDIFAITPPSSSTVAPLLPDKNDSGPSSFKPVPFTGTIPDVAAQRARALDNMDYASKLPQYIRMRATNAAQYSTILLDGLLPECLLASITEPNTSARKRTIHLHNPDASVELEKRSMTFQQSYRLNYAGEEFVWKRDSTRGKHPSYTCDVIRKPDPSVLAAQYRPPAGKCRPGIMQLMDYNLDRLDVDDRKGLEVALVMSLSALLDQEYDEQLTASGESNLYICTSGLPTDVSLLGNAAAWQEAEQRSQHSQPALPGTTTHQRNSSTDLAPETIADLEPNELLVSKWGTVEEYTSHAITLLRSDSAGQAMYLIVLRSDTPDTTQKTVQIAAAIKAAYFRLDDDAKGTIYGRTQNHQGIEEELYQYIQTPDDESPSPSSGGSALHPTPPKKRIIKLDAPSPTSPSPPPKSKPYTPPSRLKIILSKERIQELESKRPTSTLASPPANGESLLAPPGPNLPPRPTSPSTQPQGSSPGKPSKGKALLNKLGIH